MSYLEIALRLHRQQKIIKQIVENNLEDHAAYKYIPPRDRVKRAKLRVPRGSINPEPIVQFYFELLRKIKEKRGQKIPLSKLDYLLLQNEESVKKNITKTGRYLSEVKLYRFEKTVLGIALALSFPQVPKQEVANLIGISGTAIRTNLALKKFAGGTIATQVNLVIRKQINLHSIFDYLEIVVSAPKIPQVETKDLGAVADKVQKIEAQILSITELLKEKDLFWDEAIILATAICTSCPSIKKEVVKRIITSTIDRKVKFHQIEMLQKELVTGKPVVKKELLLGELLEERETDVLCAKCGKFVFLQIYSNNKKIFACKHC